LDLDANEVALVFRARGVPAEEARRRTDELLRTGASLGAAADRADGAAADGHEVVGTGLGAALSSFGFFATGAAVPVLPFLLGLRGTTALATAAALVGLALMLTGAAVGLLSGGPPVRRALRQLTIGTIAAVITYALGALVGGTLG
ncbi:MAG: VIT1/CCC1 transporter family protein, partial [Pseudonocardiales bacterium]|nr:VIT1/CCC1 transporter family protein [Pseudonocardiales bacterium]